MAFAFVLDRHAEEAAGLYRLRLGATYAPHYALSDLALLDDRIEAHVEALAGQRDGVRATRGLPLEPGAAFARMVAALDHKNPSALAEVLDAVEGQPELLDDVVGALRWLPLQRSAWAVRAMLDAACPDALKRFGLAAHVAHRSDPGAVLVDALGAASEPLRALAHEGAALLGRVDLLNELTFDMTSPHPALARASVWSCALLGDATATQRLWQQIQGDAPWERAALAIAVERSDPALTRAQIAAWLLDPARQRPAVVAAGMVGGRATLRALVPLLTDPALARLAGEAIARSTGLAITGPLLGPPLAELTDPNDDPDDENVALDPDRALPWPHPERLAAALAAQPNDESSPLWGAAKDEAQFARALQTGSQRLRWEVAFQRAVHHPGPVADTVGPSYAVAR